MPHTTALRATSAFITFEGGEGAGKSTQLRRLAETLAGKGYDILATREPGGSPGAEMLRGLLLNGGHDWSPGAETLLHFAARADHVAATIRPALEDGKIVLCDRFYDSTLAYQGYGQGADITTIKTLIGLVGLTPSLTFVFEVSEAVARARLATRGTAADRYEARDSAFHARVAAGFRAIAEAEPERCVLIQADDDVDSVHETVLREVNRFLA